VDRDFRLKVAEIDRVKDLVYVWRLLIATMIETALFVAAAAGSVGQAPDVPLGELTDKIRTYRLMR
jgi:hypothetical protein